MPRPPASGASGRRSATDASLRQRVAALEAELGYRSQETQRRFRNMLGMIRAIIRQTGEDVATLEDYRAQIEGRIGSFTRVQSLLLADYEGGMDLFTLVADEVLLAGLGGGAIECHGESAQLSAAAASLFALLMHELVHLVASDPMVTSDYPLATISREISDREKGRFLCIHWQQRGRDRSEEPSRISFGWIEDSLVYELGAVIERQQRKEGLCRSYAIPLETALISAC
ncbi:MAG: hypothetical protein J7494_06210 [Sphingobium sp.]|nr:hypothetical protein [Sphingobium sp.]